MRPSSRRPSKIAPRPRTLKEFCALVTDEGIPHVVKIGRRSFYDPQGLLAFAQAQRIDPFSVGLYLGEEKQDFTATSALVDLLAQRTTKRVVVSDHAAWLFLCGRDILMDGVTKAGPYFQDERVIVADKEDRVLGMGRIFAQYEPKMGNKIYVKHVLDKGEYLRRER